MRDGNDLTAAVTGGLLPRHVWIDREPRLHCLLWGGEHDPTVLLVHGNGGHSHWWDALVPFFVPRFRLVVPDLRGHGESEWPQRPAYRIADFAADLFATADRYVPGRFAIIAHSMGARAAAWFAAHHPERVRGLALLDTTLSGVDAETAQRWRGRVIGQRHGRAYASYEDAIAAFRFVPPEDGVAPAIRADLAHHAVCERANQWTFRFDRAVLSLEGDGAGDIAGLVGTATCPIWVGRGSGSPVIVRREFDRLRAQRPGIQVHDFAGGHHFFVSHPEEAGSALRDFLDRLPP